MELAGPGLLAILGLLLVKEAGLPIPVPGDLVVIGAGVAASQGRLDPPIALAGIIAVSIVGGAIQYALVRSVARPTLLRVLGRVTSADRLDRQTARLRSGGARSVALARSTPGVRIVAIAASALAAIPPTAFVVGLTVGNALFITAHFGLGLVLGEPIVRVVGSALGPLAVAGVLLAGFGALGWLLLGRWRARSATAPAASLASAAAWADACCPACLGLAAVEVSPVR
jgi:membrane protein DedA with SNARE-associated domain